MTAANQGEVPQCKHEYAQTERNAHCIGKEWKMAHSQKQQLLRRNEREKDKGLEYQEEQTPGVKHSINNGRIQWRQITEFMDENSRPTITGNGESVTRSEYNRNYLHILAEAEK